MKHKIRRKTPKKEGLHPSSRIGKYSDSSDPWLQLINDNIEHLNIYFSKLPRNYLWRSISSAQFQDLVEGKIDSGSLTAIQLNRLYWGDAMRGFEALTLTSTWRLHNLLRDTLHATSEERIVSAAILSRSALETVAHYTDTARRFSALSEHAFNSNFHRDVVVSQDLEDLALRSIFASRKAETEEFYKPTNITTIISKTAKVLGQERILEIYETLCEVTHPNFTGRSVYIESVAPSSLEKHTDIQLSQYCTASGEPIMEAVAWAVSWSAGTQVSAARLMQGSIAALNKKLSIALN